MRGPGGRGGRKRPRYGVLGVWALVCVWWVEGELTLTRNIVQDRTGHLGLFAMREWFRLKSAERSRRSRRTSISFNRVC